MLLLLDANIFVVCNDTDVSPSKSVLHDVFVCSEDGAAGCVALIGVLSIVLLERLDAVDLHKRLLLNLISVCYVELLAVFADLVALTIQPVVGLLERALLEGGN